MSDRKRIEFQDREGDWFTFEGDPERMAAAFWDEDDLTGIETMVDLGGGMVVPLRELMESGDPSQADIDAHNAAMIDAAVDAAAKARFHSGEPTPARRTGEG